jgi:hypothetical protein
MRSVVTLVLLLTFLVLACSTVDEVDSGGSLHLPALQSYTVYVDPSVSPLGQTAIVEAVRQWEEFTDVTIDVRQGPHVCIFEPSCFAVYEINFADFNTIVDGSYIGYTIPSFVFLSTAISSYDEEQDTVIHEFGHMLGLLHPCTAPCFEDAIMNPTYRNGADEVTCLDVEQFNAIRPEIDAGVPAMACTDASGPRDEAADGGPGGDL